VAAIAALSFVFVVQAAAPAPEKVTFSGSLGMSPLEVGMVGTLSGVLTPALELEATTKISIGGTEQVPYVELDLTASVTSASKYM
jgi:hypothetical protein